MKDFVKQWRDYIIIPTLNLMDMNGTKNASSDVAIALMLGTIAQESQFNYIRQTGYNSGNLKDGGFGYYQMELATHNDVVYRYMKQFNSSLFGLLDRVKTHCLSDVQNLILNLSYATIVARARYLMIAEPLPNKTDNDYILKLANYWKDHYNTQLGSGTVQQFIQNYKTLVA